MMLRIYVVVLEMARLSAPITEQLERHDRDLARQMRRAVTSVVLNTAEGMGNTGGHKRQRYQTALGSAREVKGCVDVALALRYIHEVDTVFADRLDHGSAALVRLVRGRR